MVGQQGRKTFESERISFLQALGEVGGVTLGGDLKHVLLMREQNGKRTLQTIDLTNGEFLNSPNYYLKQNDVVYVKPTDRIIVSQDQSFQRTLQYLQFGFSFLNIIIILLTLF
jgi:polysaccharide export outer membrane protein